ncbi:hypothetical protein [Natronorubrum sp. FCH18a]|uniref:hypothetical protein n=1 Tax=Natronorubrum sp. FCH18a TaxID=3447018 RepID=UPI003F511A8F
MDDRRDQPHQHQQFATDRVGLTKPMTADGIVDQDDRFCELCHFAQSASYYVPAYQDGTVVCRTHANALEDGRWDGPKDGDGYAVEPLSESEEAGR